MSGEIRLTSQQIADRLAATVPEASAWVSANAGAGKTTLLRDRVIRMLLEGIAPDRILCLTYTRAAAAEMQNRIFDELARWGVLSEADLAKKIRDMVGPALTLAQESVYRLRARQIFAEAVETPGGLKIQTIHAFAERLLHLFPMEAGVPVDFTVLDDEEAATLREEARRQVLEQATGQPESRLGQAFTSLLAATGHESFSKALDQALGLLQRLDARGGILPQANEHVVFSRIFDVPPDLSEETLEESFLQALPDHATISRMTDALLDFEQIKSLKSTGEKLRRFVAAHDHASRVQAAIDLVMKADKTTGDLFLSKAVKVARPDFVVLADDIRSKVDAFLDRRKSVRGARRSEALHTFASDVYRLYSRKKAERGVLDFGDLIIRLRHLLQAAKAAWVMMKLDAAIEHILLDEAQDTTGEMWDIVQALADDFFAGEGQVRRARSLFVVGDEKQSIYSFQGAEPRVFDEKRREFARRITGKSGPDNLVARPVRLNASFRSSQDVLAMVDCVFADESRRAGLSADTAAPFHEAARQALPGLVDFWPIMEKRSEADPVTDPFGTGSAEARIARRIAGMIADWLERGERHLSDGSPVGPGDILILAQKRSSLVPRVLRELVRRGVPVAGADRLRIKAEIGVQDMLAAAEAALLPADDLTLASVLKSPLFGLDDAALEPLCRNREGGLRAEISRLAGSHPRLAAIDTRLAELEQRVHRFSPYRFLAGLLADPVPGSSGLSGRRALLKRLGADAADALDALLTDALAFERLNPPSVALFIAAQAARDREIKREMDQGHGQVRIMTVHAAKGLEAPIVILADTTRAPSPNKEDTVFAHHTASGGVLLWAGARSDEPEPITVLRLKKRAENFEEYRRLLYVGLTRAKERLYLAGGRVGKAPNADSSPKPPGERSWHALLEEAMHGAPQVQQIEGAQPGLASVLRWLPSAPLYQAVPREPLRPERHVPPRLIDHPLAEDGGIPGAQPRMPARMTAEDPRLRGTMMHLLFQHLPSLAPGIRHAMGLGILRQADCPADPAIQDAWVNEVMALMADPALEAFFAPGSRAEVTLSGHVSLANGTDVSLTRRVDRLVVAAEAVRLLDLKTGVRPPDGPGHDVLDQLALYARLLGAVFPERPVETTLLWLGEKRIETVPATILETHFQTITKA